MNAPKWSIEWIRRILAVPRTGPIVGGAVQPSPPSEDIVVVRLSRGCYSLDGGETWHDAEPLNRDQR